MKKHAIIAGLALTLGMFACTDQEEKVEQTIEVENVLDKMGQVIDSLNQEMDTLVTKTTDTLEDGSIQVEEEVVIKTVEE